MISMMKASPMVSRDTIAVGMMRRAPMVSKKCRFNRAISRVSHLRSFRIGTDTSR